MLLPVWAAALSCHSGSIPQRSVLNPEIKGHSDPVLLGKSTRERLQQLPYDSWFVKNYNDYPVDSPAADGLKSRLAGKQLKIFMGTWCGDSRREVPRIFRILDYCGIPSSSTELIMVDNNDSTYKQSPGHEEKGLYLFRVPDLLIYDGEKELGRIVESPVVSLEKDLLAILNGDGYTPHYPAAIILGNEFRTKELPEIRNELPVLADRIRPVVKVAPELRSYAHVLRTAGEKEKADIVLEISALIFPK